MCGRFAQVIKHDQLQKLLTELKLRDSSEQIELNYNLAPTQVTAAIVTRENLRYLGFFRWGLIPSWSREIGKYNLINIRSDTILEKPTFKTGLSRRRCLIPANGFYEWRQSDKAPFFIHPAEAELIFFAGIYDSWTDPDGSFIPSCSIITTEANQLMQPLHHRMPVLVLEQDREAWLDPQNTDARDLQSLLIPAPEDYLSLYPVSRYVNSVRNNSPACLEAVSGTAEIF
ncbi:MAG TPA: SOS response-associated peptidase [Candidatus Cloacimonadota bacterium]|nr:SOS response-associated peptidase [Candidatus Cloacimonadota bacterium]